MMKANNAEAARLIKKYGIKAKTKTPTRVWTKENYQEYLKTDLWKTRRKRVWKLADNACQICKSTDRLQVHHNTYERLGSELDSDMILVCENCHRMIHGLNHDSELNY